MSNETTGGFYYKGCPLFPGPEYRPIFMSECFELVYHGGGGFSWSEVWNMPIQQRRFNLKKINEYLKKVEELRNESKQVVTENTDIKKLRLPQNMPTPKEQSPFVSKIKGKK
jgi:hypothetical protein